MQSKSETKTTKDETSTTRPLPEQMPFLTKAWNAASNQYDLSTQNQFKGDFFALPNQRQFDSFDQAYDWSNGAARDTAALMGGYGAGQLQAGTNAQNAGVNGLLAMANGNQTQSAIDAANKYVAGSDVKGMVNASMYDSERAAREGTLPGIDRAAAATGNLNSDRASLQKAVVGRGLAETRANLEATTRQNLWMDGLNRYAADRAAQMQGYAGAGSLGNSMASLGYTGAQAGYDNTGKALAGATAAATGTQSLNQVGVDNNLKKWYAAYQQPWNDLQQYYGIVGDLKGGTTHTVGTGTSETTQTPSMMSVIGSGIGMFGSLFSDERYKDIKSEPLGMWKGIAPAYLYSYKHDPSQLHIGPMAQDVARVRPDAVRSVDNKLLIDTHKL